MFTHNTTTFGKWLRTHRRANDLTQKELAQQVDCAEITIRKIEADQLRPSKHLTNALMEKLNVPRNQQAVLMSLARRNHDASE